VGFFDLLAIWSLPERDSLWVSSIELPSRACTRKLYIRFARFVLDPHSIKSNFLCGYEGLSMSFLRRYEGLCMSWSLQVEYHEWVCFSRVGLWKPHSAIPCRSCSGGGSTSLSRPSRPCCIPSLISAVWCRRARRHPSRIGWIEKRQRF
jgi:hypothetical protein